MSSLPAVHQIQIQRWGKSSLIFTLFRMTKDLTDTLKKTKPVYCLQLPKLAVILNCEFKRKRRRGLTNLCTCSIWVIIQCQLYKPLIFAWINPGLHKFTNAMYGWQYRSEITNKQCKSKNKTLNDCIFFLFQVSQ